MKDSIKVLFGLATAKPIETNNNSSKSPSILESPKPYFCPVCSTALERFQPLPFFFIEKLFEHQHIHSFCVETLNVGGYLCPNCGASDRDRLYALYMDQEQAIQSGNKSILELAPSKPLSAFIRNRFPDSEYRTADLYMTGVDDKVDITDMALYPDGKFDFLICSHILEHVENDSQAMSELHRILCDDGKGIVMVPINTSIEKDYENPDIATPEGRWQHFGQDDHIRLYSKQGFKSKLARAGLTVSEYGIDFFGSASFERHGIHHRSILYIVEKSVP